MSALFFHARTIFLLLLLFCFFFYCFCFCFVYPFYYAGLYILCRKLLYINDLCQSFDFYIGIFFSVFCILLKEFITKSLNSIPIYIFFFKDLDECSEMPRLCKANGGSCVNTIGGYECQCIEGYHFDSTRRMCAGRCEYRVYQNNGNSFNLIPSIL